jgi:hypothetical protein
MKNTFFTAAALLGLALGASAQSSTVDSIASKYKLLPMPEAYTTEKAFPVIGTYQLANSADASANITITLDSASKGIVWINGLPQGPLKAYLAKSPATYRIVPQKSASGKSVPEGTLVYSRETNTLNIALGAPFNTENPTAIFPVVEPVAATSADVSAASVATVAAPATATVKVKSTTAKGKTKTKNKVIFYTATKLGVANTASNSATAPAQTPQQ